MWKYGITAVGIPWVKYAAKRRVGLRAACLTTLLASIISAPGQAQDLPPIEYETNGPLLVGDTPTLIIRSSERIDDAEVELRRGRDRQSFSFGRISRGSPAEVVFEAPTGVSEWRVEMSGTFDDAHFELGFEFEFEVSEGLEVQVPLDSVDLDARELVLILNRPAAHVDFEVLRDDGVIIGRGTVPFEGERPGTRLRVPWEQREGTVLRISLTAHDTSGFYAGTELIPWQYDIPHEDVHFETGSDEIRDVESPKIDSAYTQAVEAVNRYGEFIDINLYIAGYTDTVGSRGDNQRLSEERARSIARAFRERGFSFPIYYQGFGEDGLAVATPDSTDEIRNRRALYILAAQPPLPSAHVPRANWRPID